MKLTLSKTVRHGTIVTLHGTKLIRCGKGRKPAGVWQDAQRRLYRKLDGELIVTHTPEALQTQGECRAHFKEKAQ